MIEAQDTFLYLETVECAPADRGLQCIAVFSISAFVEARKIFASISKKGGRGGGLNAFINIYMRDTESLHCRAGLRSPLSE